MVDLERDVFQRPPTDRDEAARLFPAWSPDGSRIAYRVDSGIRVAEADGSSTVSPPKELIARAVTTPRASITQYVVTGDSERFLMARRDGPGAAELVRGWTNLLAN